MQTFSCWCWLIWLLLLLLLLWLFDRFQQFLMQINHRSVEFHHIRLWIFPLVCDFEWRQQSCTATSSSYIGPLSAHLPLHNLQMQNSRRYIPMRSSLAFVTIIYAAMLFAIVLDMVCAPKTRLWRIPLWQCHHRNSNWLNFVNHCIFHHQNYFTWILDFTMRLQTQHIQNGCRVCIV